MAPMIKPMIPAGLSPRSSASLRNRTSARKPPTKEPMMPRTIVPTMPIGSGPGTRARARKPAIRPTMMSPRMKPSMTCLLLPFGMFSGGVPAGSLPIALKNSPGWPNTTFRDPPGGPAEPAEAQGNRQ